MNCARTPSPRHFRPLAGLALGALIAAWAPAHAAELRLLETTDLHMNLVNHGCYQDKPTDNFGLAKTATLIKAVRSEMKNPSTPTSSDV